MALAILVDTFPPRKRGLAMAIYGITVLVAPILGPVVGGWITDNCTWRWIFFINLPVGVATIFLCEPGSGGNGGFEGGRRSMAKAGEG